MLEKFYQKLSENKEHQKQKKMVHYPAAGNIVENRKLKKLKILSVFRRLQLQDKSLNF